MSSAINEKAASESKVVVAAGRGVLCAAIPRLRETKVVWDDEQRSSAGRARCRDATRRKAHRELNR